MKLHILAASALALALISGSALAAREHRENTTNSGSGSTTNCGPGEMLNLGTTECQPIHDQR